MIRAFFLRLLDFLVPPTFASITANFEVQRQRLISLGNRQNEIADKQIQIILDAKLARDAAFAESERAYRVAERLTEFTQ